MNEAVQKRAERSTLDHHNHAAFPCDLMPSYSAKDKALVRPLELWREAASTGEIKRGLELSGSLQPLQLADA